MIHQPISWLGMEKKLNLTQRKHAFTNQKKKYYNTKYTQRTKTRFSRLLYDMRPGNKTGLFSKKKISETSEEKV